MKKIRQGIFVLCAIGSLAITGCGSHQTPSVLPNSPVGTSQGHLPQTAPRMPDPISVSRDHSGRIHVMTTTGDPGTVVVFGAPPLAKSAFASVPKPQLPQGATFTATPTPRPSPVPTTKPCTNVCICYQSAPKTPMYTTTRCPLTARHKAASNGSLKPYSFVGTDDDGGQSGYMIPAGSNAGVGDVYVAHVVMSNVKLTQATADDLQGYTWLYAPTTHGPNGNCWEISTMYGNTSSNPNTDTRIGFYNFCDNGGTWEGGIDSTDPRWGNYVTTYSNGNGYPEYVMEITQENLQNGGTGQWHAYLYNWVNNTWDELVSPATGQATYNGGEGWSMFETHYPVGNCSSIPTTGVSGLRLHFSTTLHQDWQYASTANTQQFQWGECFAPDGTLTPWYQLNFNFTDWGWLSQTNNYTAG